MTRTKLEKRTVGLGDRDDALMMYEIKSGLSEDDYIVGLLMICMREKKPEHGMTMILHQMKVL